MSLTPALSAQAALPPSANLSHNNALIEVRRRKFEVGSRKWEVGGEKVKLRLNEFG